MFFKVFYQITCRCFSRIILSKHSTSRRNDHTGLTSLGWREVVEASLPGTEHSCYSTNSRLAVSPGRPSFQSIWLGIGELSSSSSPPVWELWGRSPSGQTLKHVETVIVPVILGDDVQEAVLLPHVGDACNKRSKSWDWRNLAEW